MQRPRPVESHDLMFGRRLMAGWGCSVPCLLSSVLRFPRRWCAREQEWLYSWLKVAVVNDGVRKHPG